MGFPREALRDVASQSPSFYKSFAFEKPPRPFARKPRIQKARPIDNPTGLLREIQDRIYHRLLRSFEMPSYICGGVQGRSVLMNVNLHQGANVIVTVDIKSWFPSITSRHVYRVWRKILNCSPPVAKLLTRLTTFDNRLPQGAPTSTALANLVLFSIDAPIRAATNQEGVIYSSWVDDLPLSGAQARKLIPITITTLKRAGFQVARSKLLVMGSGKQRVINGVLVGRTASASKQHRARIRSALHHLRVGDVQESERERRIVSVKGSINHLASINPPQATRFQREVSELLKLPN